MLPRLSASRQSFQHPDRAAESVGAWLHRDPVGIAQSLQPLASPHFILAALLPASRCRALSLYPASSPCPGPAGPSERCCPAPKGRFPWGAPGPRRIAAHAANPTSDTKEQRSALQSTAPGSPPASPAAPGRRGRARCLPPGTEVASGLLCHHPCPSSIAPRRVPGKFFCFLCLT